MCPEILGLAEVDPWEFQFIEDRQTRIAIGNGFTICRLPPLPDDRCDSQDLLFKDFVCGIQTPVFMKMDGKQLILRIIGPGNGGSFIDKCYEFFLNFLGLLFGEIQEGEFKAYVLYADRIFWKAWT